MIHRAARNWLILNLLEILSGKYDTGELRLGARNFVSYLNAESTVEIEKSMDPAVREVASQLDMDFDPLRGISPNTRNRDIKLANRNRRYMNAILFLRSKLEFKSPRKMPRGCTAIELVVLGPLAMLIFAIASSGFHAEVNKGMYWWALGSFIVMAGILCVVIYSVVGFLMGLVVFILGVIRWIFKSERLITDEEDSWPFKSVDQLRAERERQRSQGEMKEPPALA